MESLVVIGASVGGLQALSIIVACLPANFPAPILVVTHVGARQSVLPEILSACCALPVRHARDGELVQAGSILLAPPDWHMPVVMHAGICSIALNHGARESYTRPAINPLFRSAANVYGVNAIGVILSGYLDDGTAGMLAIKQGGGKTVVQQPFDAMAASMPQSALDNVDIDWCLPAARIGPLLLALLMPLQAVPSPFSLLHNAKLGPVEP